MEASGTPGLLKPFQVGSMMPTNGRRFQPRNSKAAVTSKGADASSRPDAARTEACGNIIALPDLAADTALR
jgi:hypothetical protein